MSENINENININNSQSTDSVNIDTSKNEGKKYRDYHSNKKYLSNKYFLWGLTGFLTIIACIAVYLLLVNIGVVFKFFQSVNKVLMPVYLGMIIAYLLTLYLIL